MTIPTPLTPLPWHVVPDEDGAAWVCAPDGTSIAYVEHMEDAEYLAAAVQYYADARALRDLVQTRQEGQP